MLIQQIEGHMLDRNKIFAIFYNSDNICQRFLLGLVRFYQIDSVKMGHLLVNTVKVFDALLMFIDGHFDPGIYPFEQDLSWSI